MSESETIKKYAQRMTAFEAWSFAFQDGLYAHTADGNRIGSPLRAVKADDGWDFVDPDSGRAMSFLGEGCGCSQSQIEVTEIRVRVVPCLGLHPLRTLWPCSWQSITPVAWVKRPGRSMQPSSGAWRRPSCGLKCSSRPKQQSWMAPRSGPHA